MYQIITTWCNYNSSNGRFMMDCVVSIKGLLWGFSADKNKPHGGGVYCSNGVADFTPDGGLNYCTSVSTDFSKIEAGEYLCMKGTGHSHAGVYLGNGKVFECTVAWNTYKCVISDIDSSGIRSYNGVKSLRWTYHGKLDYIDYSNEPTPTPTPTHKYKVGDVVEINGVYTSSTSTKKLTPLFKSGEITRIVDDAPNPYLLNDGAIGWINDTCVVEDEHIYKKVVNCYWLNLRKSPSYGNNVYKSVPKGTVVEYLGMESGWAKIIYGGKTLYCGSGYLE